MVGRDDAAEGPPRIGVHAELPAESFGRPAVDHFKGQRELLPEFLLPLIAKGRRCQNEDSADAPPEEEFREDQAGLDRLPESHIIRDQQADPGHPQRLQERDQLEVFDTHAPVERTRDWFVALFTALTVKPEVGGQGSPPSGPHERVEVGRRHGIGLERVGEGGRFKSGRLRLEFPQNPLTRRRSAVLVLQVNEMKSSRLAVEGVNGCHGAPPVPDGG